MPIEMTPERTHAVEMWIEALGLDPRDETILHQNDLHRVKDVLGKSEEQLLNMKGIGQNIVNRVLKKIKVLLEIPDAPNVPTEVCREDAA